MNILAIDVSKDELVVFDSKHVFTLRNKACEINSLLSRYPDYGVVAEPTSTYHLALAEQAFQAGRQVYLVNPRDLKHFRESRSFRAKTDRLDAHYLHDYVEAFMAKLRPWSPLPDDLRKLKNALRRWFHLSKSLSKMAQVFQGYSHAELNKALESLRKLLEQTEEEAVELAKSVHPTCYARILKAPGLGTFSACCFTFVLIAKPLKTSDAMTAYLGLDLRVSDSGKKKGKRFITKRGDRILRYAATCAGRGLLNTRAGRKVNEGLKAKGRKLPERLVIAARKVIRTVHAIHSQQTTFDPQKWTWTLT